MSIHVEIKCSDLIKTLVCMTRSRKKGRDMMYQYPMFQDRPGRRTELRWAPIGGKRRAEWLDERVIRERTTRKDMCRPRLPHKDGDQVAYGYQDLHEISNIRNVRKARDRPFQAWEWLIHQYIPNWKNVVITFWSPGTVFLSGVPPSRSLPTVGNFEMCLKAMKKREAMAAGSKS